MNKRPREGRKEGWTLKGGFTVLHDVFLLSLAIKGINAIVEIVSGLLLFFISVRSLKGIVGQIASLGGSPWLRHYWPMIFYRLERWIAPDTKAFFSWFFVSHGAAKAFIVICLLCGWLWAYPLGITVFSLFIIYQVSEIIKGQNSVLYIILTAMDLFVIYLTINEWRHAVHLRRQKQASAASEG